MDKHPATAITLPAFGAYIPSQGGHFAAIMRGPTVNGVEQPPYALLVSSADTETISEWGPYGKEVEGSTSRTNGAANTDAMVLAQCQAAINVRELTVDGHADFYLPALGELNAAAANVPELFDDEGVYWTSTQLSRYDAFVQDFESGNSFWGSKGGQRRVRAFRRIQLDLLNA